MPGFIGASCPDRFSHHAKLRHAEKAGKPWSSGFSLVNHRRNGKRASGRVKVDAAASDAEPRFGVTAQVNSRSCYSKTSQNVAEFAFFSIRTAINSLWEQRPFQLPRKGVLWRPEQLRFG